MKTNQQPVIRLAEIEGDLPVQNLEQFGNAVVHGHGLANSGGYHAPSKVGPSCLTVTWDSRETASTSGWRVMVSSLTAVVSYRVEETSQVDVENPKSGASTSSAILAW